jgi:hypothetical protein
MVNSNLSKNLQQWLDNNGYKMNVSHLTNQGDQNIKKYVKERVDNDANFVLKLAEHYANDYELINRVKFYGN